jgi:hypothetical protein
MSDTKAIRILQSTFWDAKMGWVKRPPSNEDLSYAIQAGVMFLPENVSHDELNERAINAVGNTSKRRVVEAFISSLTSRRLEIRSALASYACGVKIPRHSNLDPKAVPCKVCHSYANGGKEDLNVLNFERYKFGGVRHLNPLYIALDLELFASESFEEPTEVGLDILREVFNALRGLKSGRLSQAPAALGKCLKGNKNEREAIVSTLGYCGILKVPGYQPFYRKYIHSDQRKHSSYSKSDWPFPADLWRPEYGLDEESIDYWFGAYGS